MQLALRYDERLHSPAAAALISSGNPAVWLKEINRWGVNPAELECYIIPESIRSQKAAALFVVFKNEKQPAAELLEPCYVLAGKLYLPLHTTLYPAITEAELKEIFVWDRQLFHPAYGLTGFEKSDAIALDDLLLYAPVPEKDWSFAHPGLPARKGLQEIRFVPPDAQSLMEQLKKQIDQQPISDIPKAEGTPSTELGKLADKIKLGLFKGLSGAANGIYKMLPGGEAGANSSPGMFERLQQWLHKNIEELERRRRDEINRLLDLFETNTDEALRYALPLDSPYLNRGSFNASSELTRNNTSFDLGRLGGGRITSNWDIGDRYHDLRTKYIKAAEKEIAKGDFKKAAYVYAHLLGDYHSAANVLEQGGHFREAAALHKDHLKNMSAAAECLERGQLYQEAIELYLQLGRNEHVADLYKKTGQDAKAGNYYEQCISASLLNNDYSDAARIANEKLEQQERAASLLLKGWDEGHNAEACLKKYFDVCKAATEEDLVKQIHTIYDHHTPDKKQLALLNTLDYVQTKYGGEAVAAVTEDIAFEIVSSQAEGGNASVVHELKKFVQGDRLIGSDCSRYARRQPDKVKDDTKQSMQLDNSIRWMKAIWHGTQFLALGLRQNMLQLVRGNWYNNLEYYSWTDMVEHSASFSFVHSLYERNYVFLHSTGKTPVTRKNLPKSKYFPDVVRVDCPQAFHGTSAPMTTLGYETVVRLEAGADNITLHYYSFYGELLRSVDCKFDKDEDLFDSSYEKVNALWHYEGYFYTCDNKRIYSVSEEGQGKILVDMGMGIRMIALTQEAQYCRMVISTDKGCYLCEPAGDRLNNMSAVFATDITPSIIVFITGAVFVLADQKQASVYIVDEDEQPVFVRQFTTDANIIAVLPGQVRGQIALFEETGEISICKYIADE
jgi:MoxR-vWA-beta-propeller ternary system domain bpX3